MANTLKSLGKLRKKIVKPFKVVKADPEHLKNVIRQARENEKYWRSIGQNISEDSESEFSSDEF